MTNSGQRRTRRPGKSLLALLLLLVSGLGVCRPTADQSHEIRIGLIAPLSNDVSHWGEATVQAAEMAVKAVNEAGGLAVGGEKRPLVLLVEDSGDVPDTAVSSARKLINQDNVVALIGPQYSRQAIPVANFAENARIPMITPGSTNPATTAGKQYIYRVAFLDSFQGQVLAHFALNELNIQKAAVLYDTANAYNRDIANFFRQAFSDGGGQIVAFEYYTTGEQNFRRQLTRIRDSDPQILFLPNYTNEIPLQVQQAREMGISAAILGSDSWSAELLSALPTLDGAFFSAHFTPDDTSQQAQAFTAAYQQAYQQHPNDVAALTYDAFGLLFQAIQEQGKADPKAIQAGLSQIQRYDGVTGMMTYEGTGDPKKSVVILRIQNRAAHFYQVVHP